jgi:8-amino-7-oxononanoate synthase
MTEPVAWIDADAHTRNERALNRELIVRDPCLIDFGSNDYLGLAADPRVIAKASEAAAMFGFGAGASPLVSGWTQIHQALAEKLAEFEGAERVALFPSGFAANLGTIAALVGKGDAVYLDRLNHACLVDGARLSGATLRVYPHGNADRLGNILRRDRDGGRFRRALVVTESVFSMDGDVAPLAEIAACCAHSGAMLMVDEAHGTGVFGPGGQGASHGEGLADQVHVRVGTLSKALGSLGGFVAGSARVVAHIVNRAKPLIYSTSLPPACAAAALEALRIAQAEPWRRERIHGLGDRLRPALRLQGWEVPESRGPIIPVIVGGAETALAISADLRKNGWFVPAIRPPTVPVGTARLRISLSARHDEAIIAGLIEAVRNATGLARDPGGR